MRGTATLGCHHMRTPLQIVPHADLINPPFSSAIVSAIRFDSLKRWRAHWSEVLVVFSYHRRGRQCTIIGKRARERICIKSLKQWRAPLRCLGLRGNYYKIWSR